MTAVPSYEGCLSRAGPKARDMIALARRLRPLHGFLASRRARRLNNRPPGALNRSHRICSTRRA